MAAILRCIVVILVCYFELCLLLILMELSDKNMVWIFTYCIVVRIET